MVPFMQPGMERNAPITSSLRVVGGSRRVGVVVVSEEAVAPCGGIPLSLRYDSLKVKWTKGSSEGRLQVFKGMTALTTGERGRKMVRFGLMGESRVELSSVWSWDRVNESSTALDDVG